MLNSIFGGILIGASASLYWSGARQIAGISGIVGQVLHRAPLPRRAGLFLAGLLAASLLLGRLSGPWPSTSGELRPVWLLLTAGLLVGIGTQLANGCTSGHGVCGLSRGSPRSLVATFIFMLVAALTVLLTRHALAGGST